MRRTGGGQRLGGVGLTEDPRDDRGPGAYAAAHVAGTVPGDGDGDGPDVIDAL
jgi:hypothetical protein